MSANRFGNMDKNTKSNYPKKVELRGFERTATIADGISMKIVHSMLVAGDATALLRYLPHALARTFNMHPRMRALQVQTDDFTAEIQEPLTLEDIVTLDLLRIQQFSSTEDAFENWQQYAEDECNIAFDRYTQLPFFLTVWINESANQARLMLFSDHYMSDGYSGMIVLNSILEQVACLAKDENDDGQLKRVQVHEFPLRASFYNNSLSEMRVFKPLLKGFLALFGKATYRHVVQNFKPVLPARSDQHDFVVPPVANPTSACFAQGGPECMRKALVKCKAEGVTFAGALVSAVVVAFYQATKSQPDFDPDQPFKFMVDLDYNMRRRVPHIAEEEHVGAFISFADLEWLANEGVDMKTTLFWDLARRSKKEIDENLRHKRMMATVTIIMDQFINAKTETSFTEDVRMPNSLNSDANISNIGRYPYAREFPLTSEAGNKDKKRELTVKSLHVYNPIPHLAPSAIFFVSSVESFCYSIGHKCEKETGRDLFTTWVAVCEYMGNIGPNDTLADVLHQLQL
ncbi:hypothetical protein PC123_g3390 [Phytophthora cactorum]|nr:hypothetical protein PC123_g3390 [Phytophthora cactorum]